MEVFNYFTDPELARQIEALREDLARLMGEHAEQIEEVRELIPVIPWYDIGAGIGFLAGVLLFVIWAVTFNI